MTDDDRALNRAQLRALDAEQSLTRKRQVPISLTHEQLEPLELLAERRSTRVSALVAEAVDFYLEAQGQRDGEVLAARVAARLATARAEAAREAKREIERAPKAAAPPRMPCRYCGRLPGGRR